MQIEKIYFDTEDGVELFGLLHKPEQENKEVVIAVHGMSGNCLKKRDDILAKNYVEKGFSFFTFNNRGADYMTKLKKKTGDKEDKLIGGMIYEDILEADYDIKGAIEEMLKLGYTKIHLQGHSLGCTKILYTLYKLKDDEVINSIASVVLLSLIDIEGTQKFYLQGRFEETLEYAMSKQKEEKELDLMPNQAFIHPISVKTYLRYFNQNDKIDIARYCDEKYDFKELNSIKAPIFMRWGTENEMVVQKLDELVNFLKNKITNGKLDIGYIDGADHSYTNKEEILAKEILNFFGDVS